MPPKDRSDFPYLNNTNIDIRLMGFESGFTPFPQGISASRAEMLASHTKQFVPVYGAEFPAIFTGTEHNIGEYELNPTHRDQDIRILAVIPKYPISRGEFYINANPSRTVIYLGLEDNLIHYFNIDRYTLGSDGFGYENKFLNEHMIQPDQFVEKTQKLMTSPIHIGERYCMGVNANTAYITEDATIEDGMVVSKSFADKLTSCEIKRITISVSPNQHPLNLYGDDTEFKFMPDIDECVGDDGIMCAFRDITNETFLSDTAQIALKTPYHLHDRIYYAEPGTKIVDIDVYIPNRIGNFPKQLYTQLDKYRNGSINYFKAVINAYNQFRTEYEMSAEFHTLVTRALARLSAANEHMKNVAYKPKLKLTTKKGHLLNSIRIVITYIRDRKVSLGYKITDNFGTSTFR